MQNKIRKVLMPNIQPVNLQILKNAFSKYSGFGE